MTYTTKYLQRDSNMELLRILAMLGILVVHTDFFALGAPTKEDCIESPFLSIWRFAIESATIICVNLFVMLSGWYGIRPKKKRFLEFIFQILFYNLLFFSIFTLLTSVNTFTRSGICSILLLDRKFWFVKAYLLLYIISPILNAFTEKASKQQYSYILLGFFLFQTIYGWLFQSVSWFHSGYTTISFIGIYLLADYLHRHTQTGAGKFTFLSVFLLFVIINTFTAYCSAYYFNGSFNQRLYAYNSPLVIIASVAIFLLFTKIKFKSAFVNFVAASSFAAFLFHGNHFFADEVYVFYIKKWFTEDSIDIFSLKTTLFVLTIFIIAIIIDKVRIKIWGFISNKSKLLNN